jgi:hypothetical protein
MGELAHRDRIARSGEAHAHAGEISRASATRSLGHAEQRAAPWRSLPAAPRLDDAALPSEHSTG